MADQWLTIVEYARRFQISDMTVRRRIKTGRIPADLRDGKYYIPVVETQTGAFSEQSEPAREYSAYSPSPLEVAPHTPVQNRQLARGPSGMQGYRSAHYDKQLKPDGWQSSSSKYPESLSKTPQNLTSKFVPTAGAERGPEAVRNSDEGGVAQVATSKLFKLCDDLMSQIKENEKKLEQSLKAKCEALDEQVKRLTSEVENRDLKLNKISEQVEDLQLLVRILDETPGGKLAV